MKNSALLRLKQLEARRAADPTSYSIRGLWWGYIDPRTGELTPEITVNRAQWEKWEAFKKSSGMDGWYMTRAEIHEFLGIPDEYEKSFESA